VTDDAAPEPRYDVLITPGHSAFRVSDQGLRALVNYLTMAQLMVLREQVKGLDWTELYFDPESFAHHVFVEGDATPEVAAFEEAVMRFGPAPTGTPYGDDLGRPIHFYFELVAARFPAVSDDFLARLQQILYLRPRCVSRPHTPPPPHPPGELVPRHPAPRGAGARAMDL